MLHKFLLLSFLAASLQAQTYQSDGITIPLPTLPLPSAAANSGKSFYALTSGGNCVTSGAIVTLCYSNGSTWAAVSGSGSGSGTVNSGTINQLTYYGATGTTVNGLATANNGVLVTSSGGVPSISSTLPSGLTIPGFGGTVNSGTINQLTYYGATGTTVNGLATANNGVLVTSSGGVPSISSTLPSGLRAIPGFASLASPTFIGTVTIPNGAALGTPASLTLTNATALPVAGISGLGTGVATALAAGVSGTGQICLASGSACSGGSPTIEVNGSTIGTRSIINFIAGAGTVQTGADTGTQINIQTSPDSAITQLKANLQSGTAPNICTSASGSGTVYTASCATTLTALATEQIIWWNIDHVSASTTPTLNVDTLGAQTVTDSLGNALATTTTLAAGMQVPIWNDGTNWRVMTLPTGGGGSLDRICTIDNDTQSATPLIAANFSGGCEIPYAATITEVDVWGGTGVTGGTVTTTGTSSINVQKYTPNGGATATLLSGDLATISGYACALTATSGTCMNGNTSSSSITVSTTAISAGDWIRISAATADAVQTWFRVAIVWTVN